MKLPEYNSFEEKRKVYNHCTIDTVDGFHTWFDSVYSNKDIIFRGVNESKYKIYTSGQREWLTKRLKPNLQYHDFIQNLLNKVEEDKLINDYLHSLSTKYNDLFGLGMLQHYGAPSPLLDFSHELKNALFFAFDGVKDNTTDNPIGDYVSVYYLIPPKKPSLILEYQLLMRFLNGYAENTVELTNMFERDNRLTVEDVKKTTPYSRWGGLMYTVPSAYIPNPLKITFSKEEYPDFAFWSNMNLIAQNGCFLLYNEDEDPLGEFLKSQGFTLNCVEIHKSLGMHIQDFIQIKKEDMYPDLEVRMRNKLHEILLFDSYSIECEIGPVFL